MIHTEDNSDDWPGPEQRSASSSASTHSSQKPISTYAVKHIKCEWAWRTIHAMAKEFIHNKKRYNLCYGTLQSNALENLCYTMTHYCLFCQLEQIRKTGTWSLSSVLYTPASLHVLGLVHANSQFNLQVLVWAGLGHSHLMQLRLLWTVRGRVKDNLINNQRGLLLLVTIIWDFTPLNKHRGPSCGQHFQFMCFHIYSIINRISTLKDTGLCMSWANMYVLQHFFFFLLSTFNYFFSHPSEQ